MRDGWTALMKAANGGHFEVVKQLLVARGAEVNARNNAGWTALMKAAMEGHLALVKFLVAHGADIYIKNEEGDTALMRAACGGCLEVVKFLTSKKGDIHAKDNRGWTALMKATVGGHLEVVKFLVDDCKADVNARNKSGRYGLDMGCPRSPARGRRKEKVLREGGSLSQSGWSYLRGGEVHTAKAQAVTGFTRPSAFLGGDGNVADQHYHF